MNDTDAADTAAPDDALRIDGVEVADVSQTLTQTILGMWRSFLEHIPFLMGALVVVLLTWALASIVDRFGTRLLAHWKKRESVKELILRFIGILIWSLGLLLAAIVLFPGLTPAKALGGLGLLSIAVGLAFKDIFENFFAGILILWRFPFERGDFIECEDITGRVERVMVRMSYIRLTSGELVVVPNIFLFKNPVTILTNQQRRRVTIMAGVAYDVDVDAAVEVIEKAVRSCESIKPQQPVQIFPQGFGASSIDIEVTWWTDPRPLDVRRSRAEVVSKVKRALDDAGIEIPFPYRTLTFKEPLPVQALPRPDSEENRS